jgi:hypothetical protein
MTGVLFTQIMSLWVELMAKHAFAQLCRQEYSKGHHWCSSTIDSSSVFNKKDGKSLGPTHTRRACATFVAQALFFIDFKRYYVFVL